MINRTIKSIDTLYKGVYFRSLLEARWAYFFDQLNVKWIYEHEGFDLFYNGKYLPDFYFPGRDCYLEIKPDAIWYSEEAELSRRKCIELSMALKKRVWIVFGNPLEHFARMYENGEVEYLHCRMVFDRETPEHIVPYYNIGAQLTACYCDHKYSSKEDYPHYKEALLAVKNRLLKN